MKRSPQNEAEWQPTRDFVDNNGTLEGCRVPPGGGDGTHRFQGWEIRCNITQRYFLIATVLSLRLSLVADYVVRKISTIWPEENI